MRAMDFLDFFGAKVDSISYDTKLINSYNISW